jgi:hypothetical protein
MFLPDLRCFALNLPGGTNKNYEFFLSGHSLVLIQAGCLADISPYAWLLKLTLNNIQYHKLVLKFCQQVQSVNEMSFVVLFQSVDKKCVLYHKYRNQCKHMDVCQALIVLHC